MKKSKKVVKKKNKKTKITWSLVTKITFISFIVISLLMFLSKFLIKFDWFVILYLYSFFVVLISWWISLLIFVVSFLRDILKKYKSGKARIIVITAVLVVLSLIGVLLSGYYNVKYDLNEVYDNDDGFFIADGEVYYFTSPEYTDVDNFFLYSYRSDINKIDINGNNNKLCDFKGNGKTYFLMEKENNIYFTNNYNSYKMDVSNCKITKVDGFFDDFEKVFDPVYGDDYIYVLNHQSINKYDFKNEKIVKSLGVFMNDGLIDLKTLKSYDIGYSNDDNKYIFDDDSKLYKIPKESNSSALLKFSNDYLYFAVDYNVYKMNLSNKKVDKVGNMDKSFEYQFAHNYDRYFVKDSYIYEFNINKNKFEKIIDKKFEWFENLVEIYYFGDKVLFEDEINHMLIYDVKTKEYREFNSAKYSYDPIKSELYVMVKDGKNINIEKIK